LPTGATLNSDGTITGTAPLDASGTTYTFSIKATDAELQDVTRTFTITVNTDVVTWVTPSNGATVNLDGTAYSQTLNATSAAGKTVSYSTTDTLPTGLTLSNGVISGTPTVTQTLTSVITATAATSTRTRTNSITWVVSVGDAFFKYTTLFLNGSTTNTTFLNDASTNNIQLNLYGEAKATPYTPYTGNYNSIYFPATGNYISVANAIFNISAVNVVFTYETWILPLTAGYFFAIGSGASFGNSFTVAWNAATANKFRVLCGNGSSNPVSFESNNTYIAGSWYHVAVTRTSGGVYTLYVNGLADGTATYNAGTLTTGTTLVLNGAYDNNGLGNAGGSFYLSNTRFVIGSIVYTGSFTPPTTPLTAITNTALLTAQSNLLIDNSAYNLTLTRNNTSTYITPANPFGTQSSLTVNTDYSVYFNGTTDYLSVANSPVFTFGTGNFTVEGWFYLTGFNATANGIFQQGTSSFPGSTVNTVAFATVGSTNFQFYANGVQNVFSPVIVPVLYQWYHFAVVRNSGTTVVYLNGVSRASISDSTNYTGTYFGIGNIYGANGYLMNGYISNFRVINGTALYTSSFTPSTTALTTTYGGMATTGPATALSIGAAGSTQSLNVSNGSLTVAGDFTLECWASRRGITANQCMGCWSAGGDAFLRLNDGAVGTGSLSWSFGSYTYTTGANTDGNTFAAVGTWFHVAIVRIGTGTNNCSLYINGQLIAQASSTA
jgi:hypothetical protein